MKAYEVGVKSRLLNGRRQANAAAYWMIQGSPGHITQNAVTSRQCRAGADQGAENSRCKPCRWTT